MPEFGLTQKIAVFAAEFHPGLTAGSVSGYDWRLGTALDCDDARGGALCVPRVKRMQSQPASSWSQRHPMG